MYRKFDEAPKDRPVEYFEDIDIRELDWVESYLPVSDEVLKEDKKFFFSNVKSYSDFTISSRVLYKLIRAYCRALAHARVRPWIECQWTPDSRPKFLNFNVPDEFKPWSEAL